MKTVFLSLPMKGRTDNDIKQTIKSMARIILAMYPGEDIKFVDNFSSSHSFANEEEDETKNKSLLYLGEAIKKMAKCDYIAVIENHNCNLYNYRGCYIEEEVARNYGLHFIIINDPDGSILLPDIKAKVEEQRKACPKEEVCRRDYID